MSTTFSDANAKFALDFFCLLSRAHPYENLLFCPFNLITALGLLLYGSRGSTADEIEKILHFDELAESELPGHSEAEESSHPAGAHPSSTTELQSGSVKHTVHPGSKKHKEASPHPSPSDNKQSLEPPWCPPCEQVPDYVCEKPEGVHAVLNKVLKEINEPSMDYELSIANRMYADESLHFYQKFLYCALKLYLTEVDTVDIHNAPGDVRKLINLWVERRTFGKIKHLLHNDSFNCEADLMLVNTLYFKGQWEVKFDKELTKEEPFYYNGIKCTNVQMMHRKGQFNIGQMKGSEVQVLEIPYKNNKLSLFVLLPKDCLIESLQQLENDLTHEKLLNLSRILRPQEVDVAIPKLSIEKTIEANTYYLPHLTDPDKADMSGASSTQGAVLTHLFHDAFLEIDEEGGEEPEKPHSSKDRHLARRAPLQFVANRPFIYYVLHNNTRSLLALGQYTRPVERKDSD
ncbi:serpin B3-like [Paroedura picta]|uniref:serpin B3-like n=1 Tax=Paroedura picta TaxID=143630 RepID=UPI0040561966